MHPTYKKKRKPRTKSKSMDVQFGNVHGDGIWPDTPAKKKILKRVSQGLCPGCGNKQCTCKSRES